MDPGHGQGVNWKDFVSSASPDIQPSYFPEVRSELPRVIRVSGQEGLAAVRSDQLGLRDVYIVDGAISEKIASDWFLQLLAESGGEQVKYWHQRTYFEGETTLSSIVRRMHLASSHRTAVMMMDENIIRKAALIDNLLESLPEAVQPESDLFSQWPMSMQPAKQCLIMGGAGGCSTLHTDMLGWTGWNLLLSGQKHWKFFAPAPEVGEDLIAEVREMGGTFNLGFSCTSPVDMFHTVDGERCPDKGPNPMLSHSVFGPDVQRFPTSAHVKPLLEVVQRTGELVIFPAHYFHQTYHYGPTVAVASQMMNEGCKVRVLNQIFDFAGNGRRSLPANFWSLPTTEQMQVALTARLDLLWPGRGRDYLERMWGDGRLATRLSNPTARKELDEQTDPEPLERFTLRLACGLLDVQPFGCKAGDKKSLPIAWAMPLAESTW